MIEPVSPPKFLLFWLPGLLVSGTVDEQATKLGERFMVDVGGLPIPVVTCILGCIGIALSRPFAQRSEQDIGWKLRALVSAIMLFVVQLWIIESRPGWLFAFVVAIGLGFAGYSLLEQFASQVKDFVRRAFEGAASTIGKGPHDK